MDTSKEYIEMCRNAWVINKKMVEVGDYFNDGDICAEVLEAKNDEGFLIKSIYGEFFLPSECDWLPRQDQLQEMVAYLNKDMWHMINYFHEFACNNGVDCNIQKITLPIGYTLKMSSIEQLWLAFVMLEKFGQIWNGKKWLRKKD